MKIKTLFALGSALVLASGCVTAANPTAARKPLKIYIMAGQSNMQGKARVSTIPRMALSPESKELHDKLVDKEGKPRVLENTYMVYFTGSDGKKAPYSLETTQGKLTVFNDSFGPEFAFGVTMNETIDEPILIIKIAWGGRSLYGDFRPPSAGILVPPSNTAERWKEDGSYDENMAKLKEEFNGGGLNYRLMQKHIKEVLADPGAYHPAYDKAAGYEIAGFAWFQGYNDRIGPYPRDPNGEGNKDYSEYSRLMACFIRDVRKFVKTPDMPFVIGVLGLGGETDGPFQKGQAATADMPEFKGNVAAVLTGKYWDKELEDAGERVTKANELIEETYRATEDGKRDRSQAPTPGWEPIGTPSPEKQVWHYTTFERDYEDQYRPLKEGEKGDIRVFLDDVPPELEGWNEPDFDDSNWKEGLAPIGKGKQPKRGVHWVSPWGKGEILLMRTTFEFDPADYIDFRLSRMVDQSHNVYLNGHNIFHYQWWQGKGTYRLGDISQEDYGFFKKGTNVLAVYANTSKKDGSGMADVVIEGLTKAGQAHLLKLRDEICSARDREIEKGRSSQGFHYQGSAYTYSLIGEAFANAILEMEKAL